MGTRRKDQASILLTLANRTAMRDGCIGTALEEADTAARAAMWPERRVAAVRAAEENIVDEFGVRSKFRLPVAEDIVQVIIGYDICGGAFV